MHMYIYSKIFGRWNPHLEMFHVQAYRHVKRYAYIFFQLCLNNSSATFLFVYDGWRSQVVSVSACNASFWCYTSRVRTPKGHGDPEIGCLPPLRKPNLATLLIWGKTAVCRYIHTYDGLISFISNFLILDIWYIWKNSVSSEETNYTCWNSLYIKFKKYIY